MAKKKKKNKAKSGQSKARVQQKDSVVLMREQKDVLTALRGRRASALGERIFADETVPEVQRRRLLAVGHEAYLRELLSKGHTQQAQAKAHKLVQNDSWLTDFWALSFQVRLRLVDDLPTRSGMSDWLERLRVELVDPEDLCGIETNGLGDQAQTVLDAWTLIEQKREAEALERLKKIGRRSPLVDWRLFLQVLVVARQNEVEAAEAVLSRMLAGCPARVAAEQVLASRAVTGRGPYGRRFKALEDCVGTGALKRADYTRVLTVVQKALADHRPGLATTVAASFVQSIPSQQGADYYFSLFDRMKARDFSFAHLYIRYTLSVAPHEGLLHPDVLTDIRQGVWTDSELLRVWIRVFDQARRKWEPMAREVDEWGCHEIRKELLEPLLQDCRRLVQVLPDCREIFEFWVWAERECKTGLEAAHAYAEAFADDLEVIGVAVLAFAEQCEFERAEEWLKKLPAEQASALRQSVLFRRIKQAFVAVNAARVHQLASEYCGDSLLERIQVCFMCWRVAARVEKRKLGLDLVAFDSPWLVFYCAICCEPDFRVAGFPAGLKRSLTEDPSAVVQGYLDLLRLTEREALTLDEPDLDEVLCEAMNAPGVPVALLRPALIALIVQHKGSDEMVYEGDGFIVAFKTLLDQGTADDQALAIVLRLQSVSKMGYAINFKKAERSFRVAGSLAQQDETRRIISRIFSSCGLPIGELPKKPATKKMIDAELKMQLKFKAIEQVNDRFCSRVEPVGGGGYDPFEGMDVDDIEDALEPDYDLRSIEDSWDEPEPVLSPADSKPFVFSKHTPLMEFDFEQVAFAIEITTRGKHRTAAAETFKRLVGESTLSSKAKARLMKIYNTLLEGV
jgi:hypothetical protein